VLEKELAQYIAELDAAASACTRAEDRHMYQSHLAEAARMFVALSSAEPLAQVLPLVESEAHGYGWGFLSGSSGEKAEAAFQKFADIVRGAIAT